MYTILYVDDEPGLLEISKLFLEQDGRFSVDIITSAPAALSLMNSKTYDAIISDYQMPEMDGIEFLKQIRASGNPIPFILFTGRGREEVVIQALNEGADFYIQKGGDPKSQFVELSNKIYYAVMRRRAEETLKLEEAELRKKNQELNASFEQITAVEEELRSNLDELTCQGRALRESEERYRNVVEDQTEFISRFLPDGTHVFVNEAYCRYFSKTPDEIIGTPFRPDIPKEDQKRIRAHFGSLTRDNPFATIEHRVIMPDGTIRWHQWSDRAIFDKDGHIREYQSVGRDITDKKKVEDNLRAAYERITASEEELRIQYDKLKDREQVILESEQKLQGIVQGSPIPQFVIDKNHRVVSWNRALEEYSGVKAKEVLGTTHAWKAFYDKKRPVLSNLLVENKPEKIKELYAGKYSSSKYIDGAYEVTDFFPRMRGHGIWLYFTAAVLRDYQGNIAGAVETLEDISDRKKAEEELRASNEQIAASEEELRHQFDELGKSEDARRESEKRYRDLIETTSDWIWEVDKNGIYTYASPKIRDILGYEPDEIIGKTPFDLMPPGESEKVAGIFNSYIIAQKPFAGLENINVHKDGRHVVLETSGVPFFDDGHALLGYRGIDRDLTERKRMEDSLRADEEKYRSLVDNLNVGVYRNTTGFPGRWLWANPAFCRIFGYDSLEECLEHPVTDIYANPEERKKFVHVLETDGFVRDYELALKKKDGSHIWVSVTAQAKKSPDGTIAWIDGIIDDITALKDAKEKDRYYQFEMSRAIDYLPDATFIIDRKGTVIAWNRAIEEMTGAGANDIIGKGDYEYALPLYGQRRPILIDLIFASKDEIQKGGYGEIKRTGEILSVEASGPTIKGKPAIIRAIAAPVYDESGHVTGAIETITDITELKQVHEDLRESENRYRTIFENTGTATVLLEENTKISIANAGFERLSGYSREDLVGKKSWTEFVVKEDLESMLAQHRLRRERNEAALRHYEFRFVTKTGEIRNIVLTIDVIPGTKQSVASLMDITAQIRAQDAVKLANKKLNLLNSITRHDILNQLSGLFGFFELMQQRLDDPVSLSYLKEQKQAAETIKKLIEFARDYQEVGVHSPEWQQVSGIIHKSVEALTLKGITVSDDTGDKEIFADLLLGKVFYTLAENAVRHGETVNKIRFTTDETHDAPKIICEDNGRGVPAEAKEQIFRREYYQHTGLGLFLAREILSITGITITETGEPGKGARFEIAVPKGMWRSTTKGQ
jgi:PAS domain S-box-containing protein